MRKLLVLLALSSGMLVACSGSEEAPPGRGDTEQAIIQAFLFSLNVQTLNGNYWTGAGNIEQCAGSTTEALLYCGTTLPPLESTLQSEYPQNVQLQLTNAGNSLRGTLLIFTPQVNNSIVRHEFQVTGEVEPGQSIQNGLVRLTPTSSTSSDAAVSAALSGFVAEALPTLEDPDQLVGTFTLQLSGGSQNGVTTLNYNFTAEKEL